MKSEKTNCSGNGFKRSSKRLKRRSMLFFRHFTYAANPFSISVSITCKSWRKFIDGCNLSHLKSSKNIPLLFFIHIGYVIIFSSKLDVDVFYLIKSSFKILTLFYFVKNFIEILKKKKYYREKYFENDYKNYNFIDDNP